MTERSPIDAFKDVLSGTARAITRDAEVDAPLLLGALMHTQLVEQRRGAVHVLIE